MEIHQNELNILQKHVLEVNLVKHYLPYLDLLYKQDNDLLK